MVKFILPFLSFFSIAGLCENTTIGSVYTDLQKDCVEVQMATDKAPIDFYTYECKAFGGYRLEISGGDLRYSPTLYWNNQELKIEKPGAFHDPGSQFVEWVYEKSQDEEGSGNLRWIGFIYRLNVSNPDGEGASSVLYAVRLEQEKSCLVGEVSGSEKQANEKIRELLLQSKSGCK